LNSGLACPKRRIERDVDVVWAILAGEQAAFAQFLHYTSVLLTGKSLLFTQKAK
jgi:hypothetical protein